MIAAKFDVDFRSLKKEMEKAGKYLTPAKQRDIASYAGEAVEEAAKANLAGHVHEGVLRASIETIDGKSDKSPAALVGPLWSKGGKHAHLAEFGTQARRPRKKKMLRFKNQNGEWVSAAEVAPMPALHFMENAAKSAQPAVKKRFADKLADEFKKLEQ